MRLRVAPLARGSQAPCGRRRRAQAYLARARSDGPRHRCAFPTAARDRSRRWARFVGIRRAADEIAFPLAQERGHGVVERRSQGADHGDRHEGSGQERHDVHAGTPRVVVGTVSLVLTVYLIY